MAVSVTPLELITSGIKYNIKIGDREIFRNSAPLRRLGVYTKDNYDIIALTFVSYPPTPAQFKDLTARVKELKSRVEWYGDSIFLSDDPNRLKIITTAQKVIDDMQEILTTYSDVGEGKKKPDAEKVESPKKEPRADSFNEEAGEASMQEAAVSEF